MDIDFLELLTFANVKFSINQNSKSYKSVKMAVFDLLKSAKIKVAGKLLNFHIVEYPVKIPN